jgi:hypothetical protein
VYFDVLNNGFDQIGIPDSVTKVIGIVQRNFLKEYNLGISESIDISELKWLKSYNTLIVYYDKSISSNSNTQRQVKGWSAYFSTDNSIIWNKNKTLLSDVGFWYQFPQVSGVDKVGAYYSLDIGFKALIFKKRLTIGVTGTDILRTNVVPINSWTNGMIQFYSGYYGARQIKFSLEYLFGRKTGKTVSHKTSNSSERNRTG